MKKTFGILIVLCVLGQASQAQQGLIWTDKPVTDMRTAGGQKFFPLRYRTAGLNIEGMRTLLVSTPTESSTPPSQSPVILELPAPDGTMDSFRLVSYVMMEPGLALRYPEFGTYRGLDIHDPFKTVRCDWTSNGFSAIVTSRAGRYHVEPYARQNQEDYIIFYKNDYPAPNTPFVCGVDSEILEKPVKTPYRVSGDCTFRSYRLAVAATGEYSNYFGATSSADEALVLSEVVIAVNRINEPYERDVTVRLILIANTTDVFYYTPGTDPYSGSACNQLGQNQTNLDAVIGTANYDIGHVFSTGGGGCASSGVCSNSNKARGATNLSPPEGDPFYIDYVSHEMGHQFSASHTFNNSCGGNISTANAYEPGSGTTIMAYAGVCSPNVQPNSDDYFHGRSVQQINNYISGGGTGNSCDVPITFNNSAPVLTSGADFTIPKSTPFRLTAVATDANGDPLTYCWEQYDHESGSMPPSSTNVLGPMFRSFDPDPSPIRYFPRLQDLVNNIAPVWEVLPSVTRNMEFRITVRDFHNGIAGCTDEDNVNVNTTSTSGPFVVTYPDSSLYWMEGASETVTWDVANTTSAPVSCANVDILLSTDGGFTYPVTLASNVTNDGSHTIEVPIGETSTARVMVVATNNIFFDISDQDFSIVTEIPIVTCSTQYSTDVPKIIPSSGTPTVTSTLISTLTGEIVDINVIDLEGTHTYLDDLRFTLTSPQGTSVILIDRWCGSQNNFDIDLDDQAPTGAAPCPYNDGNAYQPENPLSAFNDEIPTGTWTLTVQDLVNQDGGSLNSWALEICVSGGCSIIVTSANDSGVGTLRDALDCALPGDTITFSPALFGSTIVLQSPMVLSSDITILSTTAENITLDASLTSRALEISALTQASVKGLTIEAGFALSGSGMQNDGDLLLKDVTIHPGQFSGEELLLNFGTLTLEGDCHISQ